jgi:ABC-type Fe3+-citrate transport system substrate-binding protein
MGKLNLNLVAMLVPLLIVAIGLIGWVTTLRGDVNAAQAQVIEVRADIKPLQDETKQYAIDIQNLHELIKDIDKIEEVVEEVDVAIFRLNSIEESVKANIPAIVALEKSLAIANDQMKNIMSDHEYMGEMLEELGEKQPAGERRSYGGY